MKDYSFLKISRVQELRYTDYDKRLIFTLTFLARTELDDVLKKFP